MLGCHRRARQQLIRGGKELRLTLDSGVSPDPEDLSREKLEAFHQLNKHTEALANLLQASKTGIRALKINY